MGTNGKSVPYKVIAAKISALTKPWLNKTRNFYVLFDREGRPEPVEALLDGVKAECAAMGLDLSAFTFGAPDRMIENWMLADPAAVSNYIGVPVYDYDFEGKGGKGIIKGFFASQKKKYFESTDGPAILRNCSHEAIKNNSPSAKEFLESVALPCRWLGTAPQY